MSELCFACKFKHSPVRCIIDDMYTELSTVEPHYNEVLGTMQITLLYQVSHYIWVKNKEI